MVFLLQAAAKNTPIMPAGRTIAARYQRGQISITTHGQSGLPASAVSEVHHPLILWTGRCASAQLYGADCLHASPALPNLLLRTSE